MNRAAQFRGSFLLAVLFVVLGVLVPGEVQAAVTFTDNVSPAASSSWNSTTDGYVGYTGNGAVLVNGGSGLVSGGGYLGNYGVGPTHGTMTVDGVGSTWTNSGTLSVGHYGIGELYVQNGGAVSSTTSYIGYDGQFGAGIGTATVTGNSTWTNSGVLCVGYGDTLGGGGSGTLNIQTGGTVSSVGAFIGRRGAAGTVTVDGPGSTWITTAYFHEGEQVYMGGLDVGWGNSGTLNIQNGGYVQVIGATTVATGDGPGTINFNGGTLTTNELWTAPTNLTGTGTILTNGLVSDVNLTFDGSAITTAAFGTAGTMTVDMSATSGNGELGVGYMGTATLTIRNGAVVYSETGILGCRATDSTGNATVNAATWNMSGELRVGGLGQGTLLIENGGHVSNTNADGYVGGYGHDSAGTVTVDGPSSTWAMTGYYNEEWGAYAGGQLYVGKNTNGAGTLNITGGAVVSNINGYIGGNESFSEEGMEPTGTVTVDAAAWNNSGNLNVGYSGTGILNIQSGGSVSVGSATVLAFGTYFGVTNCSGTINFGPGGGTLSTKSLYASPSQLTGTGTIDTHGLVSDYALTLDAATKTFTINGNVSVNLNVGDSNNSGDLGAGYQGAGSLDISNGVTAYSAMGYVGHGTNSSGTVTVTGANSTWANAANIYVGHGFLGSAGTLNIQNGGSANTEKLYVGYGPYGSGTLEITGGGSVSTATGYIADGAYSTGMATVTGAGSTWTNSGFLYIGGYRGTGTLNVSGGGTVVATGGLATGSRGNGTLNLMADGTVVANSLTGANRSTSVVNYNFDGGTLKALDANNATWIAPGSAGTTSVYVKAGGARFDTNGYDLGIAMVLTGDTVSTGGGVTKTGDGTLTLSGVNTYTGATTVKAGTLALVGVDTATPSAWDAVLTGGGADLQSGKLVFNYAGGTSPADTITTILDDSFGTSNPFSQGNGAQIYSITADSSHGLGWLDDGVDEVTVMYTLYGDSNCDGSVNGTDLNAVLSYYNQSSQIWGHGDFNYDGSVNGTDLNTVLSNYNQSLPASTAAVPEPSTLLLMVLGLVGLLAWRKKLMI